jgi:DNA replication and repair protein RecF
MHVRSLDLEEFRLYPNLSIVIPPNGLRIVGPNAAGKSTLVEAIALLATMRSPRTGSDRELIRWGSGVELGFPPYARASATVSLSAGEIEIDIGLQVDPSGEGPLKKSVKINGRPVRAIDAVGRLKVVLFTPEDVALISGAPSGRRRYLDLLISQLDNRYVRSLARYNRIVEQRNSLLKSLKGQARSTESIAAQLSFWNDEMVTYGAYLVARRRAVCAGLAIRVRERFREFSSNGELELSYRCTVSNEISDDAIVASGIELARDRVQRNFEMRLAELRADELRRGQTLVGPHRDDFDLLLDGKPVGTYGSRGQQRLAVVSLKLAESDQMRIEAGEPPVILLDDVLSELDQLHRERLLSGAATSGAQCIITSTDVHLLAQSALKELPIVRVAPGSIQFSDDVSQES